MRAIEQWRSPNHGERMSGPIDILLLHYTGMPDSGQALRWLANPASEVSCHYFVFEDGRTLQLVDEERRAWHAGKSAWAGDTDVNSRSIGIEVANAGHPGGLPDFPDAQIAAVAKLCRSILGRHAIPPYRVLAHSDVAPGRKVDPGERFPWARLAAEDVGHWVIPAPAGTGPSLSLDDRGEPVAALQAMFSLYGYEIAVSGLFDRQTRDVQSAFQQHFRQERVDGAADAGSVDTFKRLLAGID